MRSDYDQEKNFQYTIPPSIKISMMMMTIRTNLLVMTLKRKKRSLEPTE